MDKQIEWDAYFMNVAILTSLRSKDTTKVGACIASKENRIVGCGYNGVPHGLNASDFPTSRDVEHLSYECTKYPYLVHAEANALCNSTVYDLSKSRIYVTLFPCCSCAALLLQKGISEVIYLSDKHHDDPIYIASRKLLSAANVITRQYDCEVLL